VVLTRFSNLLADLAEVVAIAGAELGIAVAAVFRIDSRTIFIDAAFHAGFETHSIGRIATAEESGVAPAFHFFHVAGFVGTADGDRAPMDAVLRSIANAETVLVAAMVATISALRRGRIDASAVRLATLVRLGLTETRFEATELIGHALAIYALEAVGRRAVLMIQVARAAAAELIVERNVDAASQIVLIENAADKPLLYVAERDANFVHAFPAHEQAVGIERAGDRCAGRGGGRLAGRRGRRLGGG
jgi:hypothetical protein